MSEGQSIRRRRKFVPREETVAIHKNERMPDGRMYELRVRTKNGVRRTHAYCSMSKTIDGITYRCCFEQRLDNMRKEMAMGNYQRHVCEFEACNRQIDLSRFVDPQSFGESGEGPLKKVSVEEAHRFLVGELAYLTGRHNMPIDDAIDEDMSKFVGTLLALGAQLGREKIRTESVKMPTKKEVRAALISIGKALNNSRLEEYSVCRYSAMAVDEGSTMKRKYCNFVLHNAEFKLGEYLFYSDLMDGLTHIQYNNALRNGVQILKAHRIVPSTIVVDGGTACLKSLRDPWPNKPEELCKIIVVPCLCHRINNAFKGMTRSCKSLDEAITQLHHLADMINSVDHNLSKCPTHVSTRWLYDYELVHYVLTNQNEINRLARDHNWGAECMSLLDKIEELHNVITPLRTLCDMFEQSNRRLGTAAGIILTLVEEMSQVIASCEHDLSTGGIAGDRQAKLLWRKELFTHAITNLRSYTLDSPEGGLLGLAWLLTPEGHDNFTKSNNNITELTVSTNGKERSTNALRNIQRKYKFTASKSKKEKEIKRDPFLAHLLKPKNQPDQGDETELSIPAITFSQDEIDNALLSIGHKLKLHPNRVTALLSVFHSYLLRKYDKQSFNLMVTLDGDYNWGMIKGRGQDLADIAMRLAPCPCSESSAERSISMQRVIMTPRRSTAKEDLHTARLQIMNAGSRSKRGELALPVPTEKTAGASATTILTDSLDDEADFEAEEDAVLEKTIEEIIEELSSDEDQDQFEQDVQHENNYGSVTQAPDPTSERTTVNNKRVMRNDIRSFLER